MKKVVLLPVIALAVLIFFSCSPTENDVPDFSAKLISTTDCKTFSNEGSSQIEGDTPANLDCFEYSYADGILKIKHINTGFNCCPGKLSADITRNGNLITISESEENPGCHCNCLFDIDYELKGLSQSVYHIKFIEPYRLPDEPVLEVDIDLSKNLQDKFCVERKHYPWMN